MVEITTIQISKNLRDRLKLLGSKGEYYETVIERLYKFYQKNHISPRSGIGNSSDKRLSFPRRARKQ